MALGFMEEDGASSSFFEQTDLTNAYKTGYVNKAGRGAGKGLDTQRLLNDMFTPKEAQAINAINQAQAASLQSLMDALDDLDF